MNRLLACALVALLPAVASAQTDCRKIDTDLDRLACYDRASGRTASTTPVETESAWLVRVATSEMTDDKNVYLTVDADDPVSCQYGQVDTPTLLLRCHENTTSLVISTNKCHLTSSDYDNYGDVTYRIDDTKSKTLRFDESTSNDSLGLWHGGASIPFIKALFDHDELIARFTPFSGSPVTAHFRIDGIEDAITPLREACGW